jgi:broad specificity phosphatase PhoE
LGVPLATDLGLRETNVGAAEGMIWADAKARFGEELTERWYSDNDAAFPGGETGLATLTRGLAALRRFAIAHPYRRVDAWRDGASAGQTLATARQHARQSAQHSALCLAL